MRRSIKILLTVLVAGGAIVWLMSSSLEADVSTYKYVDELMVEPAEWEGQRIKAHGYVQPGTIDKKIEGHQQITRFILERKGKQVHVTTSAVIPDTFKDLAEVIASGTLHAQPDGTYQLEAVEIMAKCPSKYEENRRTKNLGS